MRKKDRSITQCVMCKDEPPVAGHAVVSIMDVDADLYHKPVRSTAMDEEEIRMNKEEKEEKEEEKNRALAIKKLGDGLLCGYVSEAQAVDRRASRL